MNFGAQPPNPLPQQSTSINNINQHYYQQPYNMSQYQGYPYSFPNNNYQYPNVYMPQNYNNFSTQSYYNPMVQTNTDSNININQNVRNKVVEKRESKPLTVIDPNKNEVLDLIKISQSKNTSLLDEIQKSDNSLLDEIHRPDNSQTITSSIPISDILNEKIEIIESYKQSSTEQIKSYEKIEKHFVLSETYTNSLSMKQSQSIPNKLDDFSENNLIRQISSSSDTDLHQKSNASLINLEDEYNNQRKIYNRDLLMEIGKLDRSLQLPISLVHFECKDILIPHSNDNQKSAMFNIYGLNKKRHFNINQKVINIGSPKSGSLSRITNGYLPPHLRLIEECSLNKHLENCHRNLKSILNKIAPQNFDTCIKEIKSIIKSCDPQNVPIDDCIYCLIEEIFDKAVKEEAYSVTYANLCSQIAKFDDENESKWNFKSSLLNRCKKMFETPLQDQLKSVKEHWEKKVEEELDEKLRNLYRSDIEEQIKKAQDKYFGNIRFIGELYLQDLLKPKIIHCCVTSLLPKSSDEDAMLSLCKLIETCGQKFDEKHRDKMADYIKSMTEIIQNEQLETRIRFRVLDIIEMSERNWSLRKIQAQKMIRPKTLEEVKNDDSEDKAIAASKFSSSKSQNRVINTKPTQNLNELRIKLVQQTRNQVIDVNSLSVGQNENFDLKPTNVCWTSGSKDNTEWKNVESKKSGRSKFSHSYGKHSQQSRGPHKSSPIRSGDESPGKLVRNSKFSALISHDEGNDNSLPNSISPVRDPSPCESKSEDDIVIMDGDELLDNLLETKTLNVVAWCNQNDISELISHWLDRIMEKDKLVRNLVGDQLSNLVVCDKLPMDKLIDGLTQFLELIDDLITDIPEIWTYLAQILERFINQTNSYVEFYQKIFETRLPNRNITECVLRILEYATVRVGKDVIKELVDGCLRPLFDKLAESTALSAQLKLHDLTFLSDVDQLSLHVKFTEEFKCELISNLPNDTEIIYKLLEDEFTLEEMQTEDFVFSMAFCIFSFICNLESEEVIINYLIEKQLFFKRLIDHKSAFETQTLLALVNFATKLEERDLLQTIVNNLNGKIISNDAFQHFINSPVSSTDHTSNNTNYALTLKAIRCTLDIDRR